MISLKTDGNCTIFTVTGEVTGDEILFQLKQYMSAERTDTALWDFSQARNVRITTLEMKGIADSIQKFSNDDVSRKVAFVGSKNINIGLGKIFAAFAEMAGVPNDYKVFRDIELAKEWLQEKKKGQ